MDEETTFMIKILQSKKYSIFLKGKASQCRRKTLVQDFEKAGKRSLRECKFRKEFIVAQNISFSERGLGKTHFG
ncbi:MAG: hypothetical protein A2007_03670 [Verrucomicrobia bacterium GWC2_42_7]|nr:MAG: hypothetical protein A2007_03670 [Verrucomicrobia bacterium GWC2_42_7]